MSADNNMMSGFYEGILITIKMFIASSVFPFVVIFIILSILLQWKIPVLKGKYGEWVVKSKLRNLGDAYTVFHDVYLSNGKWGLTQVDHIVTSVYGVLLSKQNITVVGFLVMNINHTGRKSFIRRKQKCTIQSGKITAMFKLCLPT